jgi:hypothetical protein
MTIKYGLQFFFFELTDNDGQNFLAGIVHNVFRGFTIYFYCKYGFMLLQSYVCMLFGYRRKKDCKKKLYCSFHITLRVPT